VDVSVTCICVPLYWLIHFTQTVGDRIKLSMIDAAQTRPRATWYQQVMISNCNKVFASTALTAKLYTESKHDTPLGMHTLSHTLSMSHLIPNRCRTHATKPYQVAECKFLRRMWAWHTLSGSYSIRYRHSIVLLTDYLSSPCRGTVATSSLLLCLM
jgi:hypothetical protein